MSLKFVTFALAAIATASPFDALIKATNDDPCEPCQPQGATGTTPPQIGSDLSSLYIDVLNSVKGIEFNKRSSSPVQARQSGLCCRASLDCVNVQNLNIAMCYDKFTTNFGFADNSFGSLTTGEYKSGDNAANLFTGEYTANGQSGNIYAAAPEEKPNTSTLSIPPQYTGTGVGSAVPPNQLGSVIVYTATIPGHTYSGPTTIPESVMVNTVNGVAVTTTRGPSTITQATTIPAETTVVTTTRQGAEESGAAASSTGAGARVAVDGTTSAGMGLLSALMYALYAL